LYNARTLRKSYDLKLWTSAQVFFTVPANNWATGELWAPEVHEYNGRYYLFATINSIANDFTNPATGWTSRHRAVQIFHSDSPEGPFKPFSNTPHLPVTDLTLDGTLWVENGVPYMVYCHEWLQMTDGTMEVVELKPDLSATVGKPTLLFTASSASWVRGNSGTTPTNYVTDGPFLYRTKTGKLLMIWSAHSGDGYAVGIAESDNGKLFGTWSHQSSLLFNSNGGHGMIFRSFEGKLCLVLHQPNSPSGQARAHFFELEDTGDTLIIKDEIK
jgi:GH43 family beta-xylosidase